MTYSGMPEEVWRDNPWRPGQNNIDEARAAQSWLVGGAWANKVVAEAAAVMRPEEALMYHRWALAHPTANPRSWAPLAEAGIDPYSSEGTAVAMEDVTASSFQNTYDKYLGQRTSGDLPPQSATDPTPTESDDNPWGPDWLHSAVGSVTGAMSEAGQFTADYLNPLALMKADVAFWSAGYQGMVGAMRSSAGNNADTEHLKDEIGKELNLSPEQMSDVENAFQGGAEIGSVQFAPGVYGDPIPLPDDMTEQEKADTRARGYFLEQGYEPAVADRMVTAYNAYLGGRREIVGEPDEYVREVYNQTELSALTRSLTDGVKGNYIVGRPVDGSKYDPKTRTWVNPETGEAAEWTDHNGIFMPDEARAEAEAEAIRAYDIRTPEEIKDGVAPVAWTPGRGVAHKFYDADETGFYTMSGVVDFANSLFLDPVNLIPVGALAKGAHLTQAGRAFAGAGDNIVIGARSFRFGPGGVRLPAATQWSRPGAYVAAKPVLEAGGRMTLDPEMASKGFLIEDLGGASKVVRLTEEGGLSNVPHVKYVVKDEAWRWLNSAKGSSVVQALVDMDSPYAIWQRAGQKFDMDLAVKLADAQTPEEVRAILGTRIGFDLTSSRQLGRIGARPSPIISRVPKFGDTFARGLVPHGKELEGSGLFTRKGRSSLARMNEQYGYVGAMRSLYRNPFRLAPSTGVGFSAEDPTTVAEEMSRWLRGARIPEETVAKTVDDLIRATDGVNRYYAVYDEANGPLAQVARTLTDEFDIDPAYAKKITRAFPGGHSLQDSVYFNSDLGPRSYGAHTSYGQSGRALLRGEALGMDIYLPDYRSVRRATGIIAKIAKGDSLEKAAYVNDALQSITSGWRNLVLMRPAYIIRETGEMAFSMSLAGGEGAFTHPFAFISNAMQASVAMHMQTLAGRGIKHAVGSPLRAAKYVTDEAGRVLIKNSDERAAWRGFAALPDEERPEMLRGLSEQGIDDLWASLKPEQRTAVFWDQIDKSAVEEWITFDEGVKWLFPTVFSRWARLNGTRMFDELWRAADGDEVAFQKFQTELSHVSGNLLVDEPALRGASREARALLRENPSVRRLYARALVSSKLATAAQDDIMRKLAKGWRQEDILARWRGSEDWVFRRRMRPDLWGDPTDMHTPPNLNNVTIGDDQFYIYKYQDMLTGIVGDDPVLLEAIAKNNFEGKAITAKNMKLVNYIEEKLDDAAFRERLPELLHDIPYKGTLAGTSRRVVNEFFQATGDFSDLFARAPMVRQFWADRILDMADDLTPAARQSAAAALRKAGDVALARKVLRSGRAGTRGTLGVDEADLIASGYARRMMAKTFYNAHRRQNYAVALRVVFPFIQSTMNTFKRWGMMSLQNPHLAYRTLKPIEALRDPGSAVIYEVMGDITGDEAMQGLYSPGHPEASVDGFFFHNQYGDRVFAFPGVRSVYNIIATTLNAAGGVLGQGLAPEFETLPEGSLAVARASNLNVAGVSLNPGTGPLVTFPASLLMSDDIYHDDAFGDVLRAAFPYGLPDDDSWLVRLRDSFAPTAVKRAMISPEEQANMAVKLLPSLAATGEYDLNDKGDLRRMFNDANELANRTNWFGAIFGASTPTTFSWQQAIDVSDGDKYGLVRTTMMQDILSKEWRLYTEPKSPQTAADDYNNGALRFLNDYGLWAFYSVMPRTHQEDTPLSAFPTADVWAFRTEEPETYEKYRGVIPIFFPGGDPTGEWGEAQENLYKWQKASGERTAKTADEFWKDAQVSLGWILYGQANKNLAASGLDPDTQAVIRAQIQDEIMEKMPGWTRNPVEADKFDLAMEEVKDAVGDEVIQTLPGTPYISAYLEAREDAIQSLREQGYTGTLNASYATVERANLAAFAGRLAAEDTTGTFAYAWGRLFSQELETE